MTCHACRDVSENVQAVRASTGGFLVFGAVEVEGHLGFPFRGVDACSVR